MSNVRPDCDWCGQPYHRYSTGDTEHDLNPTACINTLRGAVERRDASIAELEEEVAMYVLRDAYADQRIAELEQRNDELDEHLNVVIYERGKRIAELEALLREAREATVKKGPPSYLVTYGSGKADDGWSCQACDEYGCPWENDLIDRIDAALGTENPSSRDHE